MEVAKSPSGPSRALGTIVRPLLPSRISPLRDPPVLPRTNRRRFPHERRARSDAAAERPSGWPSAAYLSTHRSTLAAARRISIFLPAAPRQFCRRAGRFAIARQPRPIASVTALSFVTPRAVAPSHSRRPLGCVQPPQVESVSEANRSPLARPWNLLTGLTADQLSYAR